MSAEWFAGCPCVGSPRALIVYAKITAGRSRTASARRKASSRSARSCPREVGDRRRHLGVVEVGDQPLDVAPPAAVARQPLAELAGRAAQQSLIFLVAHRVDAVAQRLAAPAREQLAQAPAVLDGDRLPARGLEHAEQAADGHVRHDAVERLPVEVDDPQHLAEARDHRVDERLPDRALVELGVADERDVAAALRHVEVPGHVALRDRAPERRCRTDADRPRREVDDARILGPARIALQAAELAQPRQVAAIERAEEVVDRVQDRRRVRLHGDAVGRAQVLEVERRHDPDHRGRRRLVTADLDPRGRRAHLVRVVHHARREPQHALLDGREDVERRRLELFGGAARHAGNRTSSGREPARVEA